VKRKRGPKPERLVLPQGMDPGEALDRLLHTPPGPKKEMDPPIYKKRKRKAGKRP
jgi:hypothetical protein